MTQYFPAGGFKWFKHDEIKKNWCEYNTKRYSGWFYPEVDLEYPEKLRNFCNDYHLAPEKIETRKNMLSNYCKKIANQWSISVADVKKTYTKFVQWKQICSLLRKLVVTFKVKNKADENSLSVDV